MNENGCVDSPLSDDDNPEIEEVMEASESNDTVPHVGQIFETEEHAYAFYLQYSTTKGFGIKRNQIAKDKNGMINTREFTCTKQGHREKDKRHMDIKQPRQETRTGCKASFAIKRVKEVCQFTGKFKAYRFVEEHNHELLKPILVHMLPCQRNITEEQGRQIEVAEQSGIPLRKAHEQMGRHAGDRESLGFTRLDMKNHLRKSRQQSMGKGEPSTVVDYFDQQREKNPHFFSHMQLDSDDQITNVFWADANMIIDYNKFGDFVSFDTTYKVNKTHRPFGIFVGYNHHREVAVFGAALMYDETAPSFEWLFQTFLECMEYKAPKTIFTDQDAAMAKAIKVVLPDTCHRLCIWHLKQNAVKHVNHYFPGVHGIENALGAFFRVIEDDGEFHEKWNNMLKDYNCEDNVWLKRTFDIKEKWGFPYVRNSFSAGKSSTQLSESFNADLKDYLQSDHNLSQFFCHFDSCLKSKRYKELEAEYSLVQKLPRIKVKVKMLKQAGKVYTNYAFETFQDQFEVALDAEILGQELDDTNGDTIYKVIAESKDKLERTVRVSAECRVSCSFLLWEQMGILCSHCIKVLRDVLQLAFIPDEYILKRWTKNAKSEVVIDFKGKEIEANPHLEQDKELRTINDMFRRISCRCIETPETISYVKEASKVMLEIVEKMLKASIDGVSGGAGDTDDDGDVEPNNRLPSGFKSKEPSNLRKRRIIGQLEKSLASQERKRKRLSKIKIAGVVPRKKRSLRKKPSSQHVEHSSQHVEEGFVALLQRTEYLSHDDSLLVSSLP